MRRFVIVTSEFPPEPTVSGRMASDLALYLAAKGHDAKVICPYPSRPGALDYPKPLRGAVERERREGVSVVRVPSRVAPQSRFAGRMLESWSFGQWSSRFVWEGGPLPDAVYSATWPMLAQAWIARRAARLGVAHIAHIMDLYPESALLKVPGWVQWLTGRALVTLDRWNAWRSNPLVVISEAMRQTYIRSRGLPAQRVAVVGTWQDETPFLLLPEREEAAQAYGVPTDRFTFLFLGNIGPVAGVEHLIEGFSRASLSGAQLVIAGEGTRKPACLELAKRCPGKIRFLSEPNVKRVPLLQALADVCLLPVRRGAAISSIPSKLSSYMLSAKPVVASVDEQSDSARLIRTARCGWVIPPEEADALAQKMKEMTFLEPEDLAERGLSGRSYALEHLSKTRGVQRLGDMLIGAAESGRYQDMLRTPQENVVSSGY